MTSEPQNSEFTLKRLNPGLDACLMPSRGQNTAGRNQDRTSGLGKARVPRTRLPQPLRSHGGRLWGVGRNGQGTAQSQPGVPLWLSSDAWLRVEPGGRSSPSECGTVGPPWGSVALFLSLLFHWSSQLPVWLRSREPHVRCSCDVSRPFLLCNMQVIKHFAVSCLCWMPPPPCHCSHTIVELASTPSQNRTGMGQKVLHSGTRDRPEPL